MNNYRRLLDAKLEIRAPTMEFEINRRKIRKSIFNLWKHFQSEFSKDKNAAEYSELLDIIYDFKL
jgi:hypothetical protein